MNGGPLGVAFLFALLAIVVVLGVLFARHAARNRWPRWYAPLERPVSNVRKLPR